MKQNIYEFLQSSKNQVVSGIENISGKVTSFEIPEIVKPIDEQEIMYARSIIRKMHPLRNVGYKNTVPFLSSIQDWFCYWQPAEVNEETLNLA